MVQKSCDHQLRLVGYPIIYRVLYIPGGAGFLPSRVWIILFDCGLHIQFYKDDTQPPPPRKKWTKVTWKGTILKRNCFILQASIFRGYVSFFFRMIVYISCFRMPMLRWIHHPSSIEMRWHKCFEPCQNHGENCCTLGMVPLIINPIYTLYIYWVFIGIYGGKTPFEGLLGGLNCEGTIPRVPQFSPWQNDEQQSWVMDFGWW